MESKFKLKYHHKSIIGRAFAILALLPAGSCGDGDGPAPGDVTQGGDSVVFSAWISDAGESRASVATIETLKQTGYGVFAFRTRDDGFNPDESAGYVPDFMYNQKVEWGVPAEGSTQEKTWFYRPVKGWPGSKLSFFAYSPYCGDFGETGITGISGKETPGSPKIRFAIEKDAARQIDLLYADTEKTLNLQNAGQVDFRFKHALSRVGFRCSSEVTLDSKTTVTVRRVVFRSSALGISGELDLNSGAWDNIGTGEMEYRFETDDFISGNNVINTSSGTSVADLTADGKYLMIVPSKSVPVEITVNYDVVTIDDHLSSGAVEVNNDITSRFDFTFETGKAYWFTLRLGMKGIGVGASVSDWDNADSGWTPEEKR